jgi:hypothetical protein
MFAEWHQKAKERSKHWQLSNKKYQHSVESIFVVEYLSEYKSISKTASAHESVDPEGIVWRIQPDVKNLMGLSL